MQAWSSDRSDRYEREADHAAAAVGRGETFAVRERVESPRVQRWGISDALNYFADAANNIPGYRMFTIVLGVNPINMQQVDRTPANILRAIVEFIPGGGLITQALDKYGILDRVGNWVQQQLNTLALTGASIRNALNTFLGTLRWSDIFHLDDLWTRAVHIFSDPINRIKNMVVGFAEGIWKFVRDAILRPIAQLASTTAGWPLLTAVLGRNPITGEAVPRNADTLIGGFMTLIHEEEIWNNLKKANAVSRAWAWFQGVLSGLMGFVNQIPDLFRQALTSLEWTDVINLPSGFMKVARVFGGFLGNFISWAGDKIWNLLQIIFEVVAPSVMPYLQRVGAAFRKILKDPMSFVRNLVAAAKLGFVNFGKNFLHHLQVGLIDWLTGSLPGVYIPHALSLVEFGKFALSVLGISWAQIRAKIVRALGPNGETIMRGLETGFDIVVALIRGGPAAVWELIKEKLTDLKDTIVSGITSFVMNTIVTKAIPKLISLFIPGAGFISAIVSIYDTIKTFMEKLSRIAAAIKAFVDSIVAIANGQIAGAAAKVESTLSGLLSLAISFLASFLGLGGIADRVLAVIERVRATVDHALDIAVNWIVGQARRLFGAVRSAARNVAGAIADWWRVRQPFRAEDGSSHTLLFRGEDENAPLVFETTPTQVDTFLGSFRNPTPAQATLIASISADVALINTIRTFKRANPTAAEQAQIQKNRDDVAAGLQRISQNLGRLIGGSDWATEAKPLPLSYPKPAAANYSTLYIGPRTRVSISQGELAGAASSATGVNALSTRLKTADPTAELNWKARGYPVEVYRPVGPPKSLPEGGPPIGLDPAYQAHVGMKLKLPAAAGSTPGGHVINDALRRYGYDPSIEHTDGDHVVEMQLGGVNDFPNLWPLGSRMNQQAGSRISSATLPKPDGTSIRMSELKALAATRDVWVVIAQTEG